MRKLSSGRISRKRRFPFSAEARFEFHLAVAVQCLWCEGDLAEGQKQTELALAVARKLKDKQRVADAMSTLAAIYLERHDPRFVDTLCEATVLVGSAYGRDSLEYQMHLCLLVRVDRLSAAAEKVAEPSAMSA